MLNTGQTKKSEQRRFFSYPRIPINPHTHPTMTAIEFSWKEKHEEKCRRVFFERDDRDQSSPLGSDLHTEADRGKIRGGGDGE